MLGENQASIETGIMVNPGAIDGILFELNCFFVCVLIAPDDGLAFRTLGLRAGAYFLGRVSWGDNC